MKSTLVSSAFCVVLVVAISDPVRAVDDAKSSKENGDATADKESAPAISVASLPPLNKQKTVYLDKKGQRVLLKARVALREGLLEMLCCGAGTKEHESVLSVESKAYVIHAALVALGIDPGQPVRYEPEYIQPKGRRIDIYLNWVDTNGKRHRDKAQTWIRHAVRRYYVAKVAKLPDGVTLPKKGDLTFDEKNGELLWYGHMTEQQRDEAAAKSNDPEFKKAIARFYEESQPREMEADFVFAGSQFYKDEQTGEEFYAAEGGDLICVANFPSAMIDVSMKSASTGNNNLLFEPFTERIPPVDTEVIVELVPAPEKKPTSSQPIGKQPKKK